ncbi:MAG: NAD+ synthase [Phycisphaerales bacterium]|jgi:NAD+ synthetase|nr:NAD+ synthase [Phycisphaerales bacterium]
MLQLNPTVGDIERNMNRIIDAAKSVDADIVVTPEMSICGYPPRDLLCCHDFVQACEDAVHNIARVCSDKTIIVGHPHRDIASGRLRNRASVLQFGEVVAVSDKQLLPSYDVFDERRYFEHGLDVCTFEFNNTKIGIAICEDFWRGFDASAAPEYDNNPVQQLIDAGCKLIISPSASPFVVGKHAAHLEYSLDLASEHKVTIAMCNQVGGNDDLVFDGGSFVVSPNGILGTMKRFDKDEVVIDLDAPSISPPLDHCDDEERFNALILGTKDYFQKTGHAKALLGLSGGIDSALVATIAVAALGKDSVTGLLMPSRFSSIGSVEDAEQLARNISMEIHTLPIEHLHASFERTMSDSCLESTGLSAENAQARIRGLLLMARANQDDGSLLLATGNKSELAVGYSTLYGDMSGAISTIGDIYKTDVWSMANWINSNYQKYGFATPPIPESSINKPPSAELRPNQCDQDSLPEYDVLDSILRLHVDLDMGIDEIEEELGLPLEFISKVVRMVDISQFKRDQAAVILKTSPRSFGRGRRMPIVMQRNWATSRETT